MKINYCICVESISIVCAIATGATIAISFVPGVAPVVAFGIGIADALWGQQFYDYVQEQYDNW